MYATTPAAASAGIAQRTLLPPRAAGAVSPAAPAGLDAKAVVGDATTVRLARAIALSHIAMTLAVPSDTPRTVAAGPLAFATSSSIATMDGSFTDHVIGRATRTPNL